MEARWRAIAEPSRRKILELVWRQELSAGEIARQFDVTFGAVSQHLRVLSDAGILAARKQGRQRIYSVRKDALGPLAAVLEAMWRDRLADLKVLAEDEERSSARRNTQRARASSRSTRPRARKERKTK